MGSRIAVARGAPVTLVPAPLWVVCVLLPSRVFDHNRMASHAGGCPLWSIIGLRGPWFFSLPDAREALPGGGPSGFAQPARSQHDTEHQADHGTPYKWADTRPRRAAEVAMLAWLRSAEVFHAEAT